MFLSQVNLKKNIPIIQNSQNIQIIYIFFSFLTVFFMSIRIKNYIAKLITIFIITVPLIVFFILHNKSYDLESTNIEKVKTLNHIPNPQNKLILEKADESYNEKYKLLSNQVSQINNNLSDNYKILLKNMDSIKDNINKQISNQKKISTDLLTKYAETFQEQEKKYNTIDQNQESDIFQLDKFTKEINLDLVNNQNNILASQNSHKVIENNFTTLKKLVEEDILTYTNLSLQLIEFSNLILQHHNKLIKMQSTITTDTNNIEKNSNKINKNFNFQTLGLANLDTLINKGTDLLEKSKNNTEAINLLKEKIKNNPKSAELTEIFQNYLISHTNTNQNITNSLKNLEEQFIIFKATFDNAIKNIGDHKESYLNSQAVIDNNETKINNFKKINLMEYKDAINLNQTIQYKNTEDAQRELIISQNKIFQALFDVRTLEKNNIETTPNYTMNDFKNFLTRSLDQNYLTKINNYVIQPFLNLLFQKYIPNDNQNINYSFQMKTFIDAELQKLPAIEKEHSYLIENYLIKEICSHYITTDSLFFKKSDKEKDSTIQLNYTVNEELKNHNLITDAMENYYKIIKKGESNDYFLQNITKILERKNKFLTNLNYLDKYSIDLHSLNSSLSIKSGGSIDRKNFFDDLSDLQLVIKENIKKIIALEAFCQKSIEDYNLILKIYEKFLGKISEIKNIHKKLLQKKSISPVDQQEEINRKIISIEAIEKMYENIKNKIFVDYFQLKNVSMPQGIYFQNSNTLNNYEFTNEVRKGYEMKYLWHFINNYKGNLIKVLECLDFFRSFFIYHKSIKHFHYEL